MPLYRWSTVSLIYITPWDAGIIGKFCVPFHWQIDLRTQWGPRSGLWTLGLPYDPAIPLLDINPKEQKTTQMNVHTPIFIVVLFMIAKGGNNPNIHWQENE